MSNYVVLKPLAVVCVSHTVYALDYKGGTGWGGEEGNVL